MKVLEAGFVYNAIGYRIDPKGETPDADLTDLDSNIPDRELFDRCLRAMVVRLSDDTTSAINKERMARLGGVLRYRNGGVYVAGHGWYVRFDSATNAARRAELAASSNHVDYIKEIEIESNTLC